MVSIISSFLFILFAILCDSPITGLHQTTLIDFVLCRQCGTDIASATNVINKLSPAAESKRNDTIFGLSNVHIQKLINPYNRKFEVFTATQANCIATGDWQEADSWYPGYEWKICSCSHCNQHLGWLFEPLGTAASDRKYSSRQGFYTLILNNVISETFLNMESNNNTTTVTSTALSLTEEQLEFLKQCEEDFKDRFTELDKEYMEVRNRDKSIPPIQDPWHPFGPLRNQRDRDREHGGRYRDRGGDYYRRRDNWRLNNRYDRDRHGYSRFEPYNRRKDGDNYHSRYRSHNSKHRRS